MKALSLLYHDVISGGHFDSSGFPGESAAIYKLDRDQFERHLAAIAGVVSRTPVTVGRILEGSVTAQYSLLLTFDDGGASASTCIADMLDGFGWQGHFFIPADYVGRPTFVGKEQIRELRKKGHVIGSHSCSHPERMSSCRWPDLVREWARSVDALSDVLGEYVSVASVPGGNYSKRVAEAASVAGVKVLFTSEPTTSCRYVNDCLVLGRYTIRRGTSPELAASLAAGRPGPRLKQLFSWNVKKAAKLVGGKFYLKMRDVVLEER